MSVKVSWWDIMVGIGPQVMLGISHGGISVKGASILDEAKCNNCIVLITLFINLVFSHYAGCH